MFHALGRGHYKRAVKQFLGYSIERYENATLLSSTRILASAVTPPPPIHNTYKPRRKARERVRVLVYIHTHTEMHKIPGNSSLLRLNFVPWCLIFVGPQHVACCMSPFWQLELQDGSEISLKFGHVYPSPSTSVYTPKPVIHQTNNPSVYGPLGYTWHRNGSSDTWELSILYSKPTHAVSVQNKKLYSLLSAYKS
jgi:hypothetical protein